MPNLPGATGISVLYNSGGLFINTSSKQFKKNIIDLEVDTSKIYDLRAVEYDYISNNSHSIGLIAEEVHEILPCLVYYEDKKPFAVHYSLLSVLLLEEIKKLNSRIEILESKVLPSL